VVVPSARSALADHLLLGAGARVVAELDDNVVVVTDWGDAAAAGAGGPPSPVAIHGSGDDGIVIG